jgi:nucleoid DNA-binding protein
VTASTQEAKQIVEALGKFAAMARAAQTSRQNSSTELVNIDDDLVVSFVSSNSGRKAVVEFALRDSVYVLGKLEADKLAAAIRKAM